MTILIENESDRLEAENNKRMDVIAQNGNDGLHYDDMTEEQQWQYVEGIEVTNAEVVADKAQERKKIPVYSGFVKYFPNAIKEVAVCSRIANEQHHAGKPLHWDMDKSTDELDAMMRHLIDHTSEPIDDDGIRHMTKVAWRAMAMLERILTNKVK